MRSRIHRLATVGGSILLTSTVAAEGPGFGEIVGSELSKAGQAMLEARGEMDRLSRMIEDARDDYFDAKEAEALTPEIEQAYREALDIKDFHYFGVRLNSAMSGGQGGVIASLVGEVDKGIHPGARQDFNRWADAVMNTAVREAKAKGASGLGLLTAFPQELPAGFAANQELHEAYLTARAEAEEVRRYGPKRAAQIRLRKSDVAEYQTGEAYAVAVLGQDGYDELVARHGKDKVDGASDILRFIPQSRKQNGRLDFDLVPEYKQAQERYNLGHGDPDEVLEELAARDDFRKTPSNSANTPRKFPAQMLSFIANKFPKDGIVPTDELTDEQKGMLTIFLMYLFSEDYGHEMSGVDEKVQDFLSSLEGPNAENALYRTLQIVRRATHDGNKLKPIEDPEAIGVSTSDPLAAFKELLAAELSE